ncbi:DUF2478 domain-containing protein [Sphingobium sufflavum]|uniref:DUF2478 domain-containing protein n=1 Tax=Sphingobium sufflavum TaxID=1129547 RepID=UPI001F2E9B0E|nr:DUF2478 domain-containing protein [Sphingobium sufflavum]MCE7796668.1 DUF2478 domain-containing protein [Sphingobium sufflavum]
MDGSTRPIAVVQGAEGAVIQRIFRRLADRWMPDLRLVGVVEEPPVEDGPNRGPGYLRTLADGGHYPLFQHLGAAATGCSLDPAGAVAAGEAVRRHIAMGCDLVLLSKFGKMEAEQRSGLLPAFVDAVEQGIPVLTSVAPRYDDGWTRFADPFFVRLPADEGAIEAWWAAVRQRPEQAA